MKLLTTITTIAIILTPQVAQAGDAHLKACTRTQVAALSAGMQTYESFLNNIDRCRDAALDRLNNGVKDTDNPEALKEAQALQHSMEAVAEKQEAPSSSDDSDVLLPAWN
ncbi:MAG: hypothetical protein ACRDBG_25825 [Waterburya sp.]